MKNTHDEKKDSKNQKDEKNKLNPDMVVNNPDMQFSGRSTDYSNIRDKGHSAGSPESENREGVAGNHKIPDVDKDRNKAGHVRNQSDDMQTASDNISDTARPISKKSGVGGKTMVKNDGMNTLEGQQEGGNHGGGNAANKKYGNQEQTNSARKLARDQDGDYKGRK